MGIFLCCSFLHNEDESIILCFVNLDLKLFGVFLKVQQLVFLTTIVSTLSWDLVVGVSQSCIATPVIKVAVHLLPSRASPEVLTKY